MATMNNNRSLRPILTSQPQKFSRESPYVRQQYPLSVSSEYFSKPVYKFGVAEIWMGVLLILSGAAVLAVAMYRYGHIDETLRVHNFNDEGKHCYSAVSFSYTATGIWCGILALVTGIFGVYHRKNSSEDLLFGIMVMGAFTTMVMLVGVILSVMAAIKCADCFDDLLAINVFTTVLCFVNFIIAILLTGQSVGAGACS